MNTKLDVAYFSMEFAFHSTMPNYAGGLGVLAADTMYSAADLGRKMAGVSLVYHQDDDPTKAFDISKFMKKRKETTHVTIEDRKVVIDIWQMDIKGKNGHIVPIFFLSTNNPANPEWDRDLTKYLYASDGYTRLGQELILGVGGVRALKAVGYDHIKDYHMNEGHSAFLTLEVLRTHHYNEDEVKKRCTFTTHTPISAGHDYFDYDVIYKTINKMIPMNIKELAGETRLGMTELALELSRTSNSVAERHREVCQEMFPEYDFENVTNGVYHPRWVGKEMEALFNKYLPDWSLKPDIFKEAIKVLPNKELWSAHQKQKKELVDWINASSNFFAFNGDSDKGDKFDTETLTLVFARRFVPYKRADLIFKNINRLRDIGYKKLQLIFAGHCHPHDAFCLNLKSVIRQHAQAMRGQIKVAVLPDYNLSVAKRLVTGADVWLNTPIAPQEASGTSGMKAALNGALNLSMLDGWWIEGYQREPLAGWGFGDDSAMTHLANRDEHDSIELLDDLEKAIDCYYNHREKWEERMRHAISLLSFFNTHRLVEEYEQRVWGK